MEKLETIDMCELPLLKVIARKGKNIIDVGRECITLSNLLSVAIDLYFNDKVIRIYTNTTIEEILNPKTEQL
jgi:hypothetical protein